MQLARVFLNDMVLQRKTPIFIWGESEKEEKIEVKIDWRYLSGACEFIQ